MAMDSPEERALRASIAVHAMWANTTDYSARTAKARQVGRPYAERTASGLAINNHGRSALADADADEAFRANHRDCRFRVFGWYHINGGPLHCGACCPPPEFSPETLNKVAAIVAESIRRQQAEANVERARADAERAKIANRARQAAKLERHVKAIVDGWPELTEGQRERLRPLLQEI